MIKNIFQTAVGAFLGVILGALLGALWLMREIRKMSEERLGHRKSNSLYSQFYRGKSDKNKDKDYKFNSRDVLFSSRTEAGEVLDAMSDQIAKCGIVSVSDFYNLVGAKSTSQDENYGWDDWSIMGGFIEGVPGGYVLALSKPKRLDIA